MLTYSKRLAIVSAYKAWLETSSYNIEDGPESFISFMLTRQLLNETKCEEFAQDVFKAIQENYK